MLLLTSAALPGAHILGAQVRSIVVRFVEVILLLSTLLMEILKVLQDSIGLLPVIISCRRKGKQLDNLRYLLNTQRLL